MKRRTGELEEVEQYYHHYVVALLLGPVLDVVLGIERVLNEEALRDIDPEHEGHEGELTAARRLIDSLHDTYGGFIDAFVLDALYANGPVMTQLTNYGYSGFLVLKKQKDEPFKEALTLWQMHGPCGVEDPDRKEQVEFWDVDEIETLNSYKGKVRRCAPWSPSRTKIPRPGASPSLASARARRSPNGADRFMRSRWHIENTAFNQWIRYWNLGHVFRHTQNALSAVLLLWTLAFNLLQMFVYRRLGRRRRPKDPTDTSGTSLRSGFRHGRHPPQAHSLGSFPARYQLRPRRTRANWAARTRPAPNQPASRRGKGGSLTKQNQLLRWRPRALHAPSPELASPPG